MVELSDGSVSGTVGQSAAEKEKNLIEISQDPLDCDEYRVPRRHVGIGTAFAADFAILTSTSKNNSPMKIKAKVLLTLCIRFVQGTAAASTSASATNGTATTEPSQTAVHSTWSDSMKAFGANVLRLKARLAFLPFKSQS